MAQDEVFETSSAAFPSAIFGACPAIAPTWPPPVTTIVSVIAGIRRGATVTSTLEGSPMPVPTHFASVTTTRSQAVPPLLTAAPCTEIRLAYIYDSENNPIIFPEVGCGYGRQECCAYGFNEGVLLDQCPGNYTTQVSGTYSACCPMLGNYTLFNSAIGGQTPCASSVTGTVFVAASPLTDINDRENMDNVFAYSIPISGHAKHTVNHAAIAVPIVFGFVILLILVGAIVLRYRRKRAERSHIPISRPADQPVSKQVSPPPRAAIVARKAFDAGEREVEGPPQYLAELPGGPHHPLFDPVLRKGENMSHGSEELRSPTVSSCTAPPLRLQGKDMQYM
ncbi:uncharacterized protein PV07_12734 [Cladophialophora immunda]|uniref:Uncharacterized protein n=1 Tax=Cladophialophora immunda TaxID=569365 RepID=A0A0D2AAP1_9EURO|nr:uncharacterized protein PV07_12734 [Cladophialophora immunda]KIW21842.1 hypothetical protein PV07_12734 [Cladophialophora immunda]